jgi:hypothetical protein
VDEVAMMNAAGVPASLAANAVTTLGLMELAFAVTCLVAWSRPWPMWLCLIGMPIATVTVALSSPGFFAAAFNPFSLNLSVAALAAVDLFVIATVPSAARCLRRPPPDRS